MSSETSENTIFVQFYFTLMLAMTGRMRFITRAVVAICSCFDLIRHHQHDIATNTEGCVRQPIKGYLFAMRDAICYCRDHMMNPTWFVLLLEKQKCKSLVKRIFVACRSIRICSLASYFLSFSYSHVFDGFVLLKNLAENVDFLIKRRRGLLLKTEHENFLLIYNSVILQNLIRPVEMAW